MNSIGSSIVTMCCLRLRLIQLSIAARVVDFPDPVAPVTRTRPRCSCGEPGHALGQAEPLEAGDLLGHEAEGERDRAPLAEAVHAEAAQSVGDVGGVELAGLEELLALGGRAVGDEQEDGLEIGVRQEALLERLQVAVDPDHGGRRHLQVHVASSRVDDACQQFVQVHDDLDAIGGPSETALAQRRDEALGYTEAAAGEYPSGQRGRAVNPLAQPT